MTNQADTPTAVTNQDIPPDTQATSRKDDVTDNQTTVAEPIGTIENPLPDDIQQQVQTTLERMVSEQMSKDVSIQINRQVEEILNSLNENAKTDVANEDVTIDGVSAIAALVIAAFAVDRFATFFMFMLSLVPGIHKFIPNPKYARQIQRDVVLPSTTATTSSDVDRGPTQADADVPEREVPEMVAAEARQLDGFREGLGHNRYYIAYYLFAFAGATILAGLGNIQVLHIVGFKGAHESLEIPLTVLLLTAGADRIKALFASAGIGDGEPADAKPLEISGSLNLEGLTQNN